MELRTNTLDSHDLTERDEFNTTALYQAYKDGTQVLKILTVTSRFSTRTQRHL